MTTKSGWCIGPPGARIHHEKCPVATCGCECHRSENPAQPKGFEVNWGYVKTAPGGALTPNSQGLADTVRSVD